MSLSAEDKFVAAKLTLQTKATFFFALSTNLKFIETEYVQSIAVDIRSNLYWNRSFVDSLCTLEVAGVLAHESLHTAFMHCHRTNGRHADLWNIAVDIKTNAMCLLMQLQLPKGGIIPDVNSDSIKITINGVNIFIEKLTDLTAEDIYDKLYHELVKNNALPPESKDCNTLGEPQSGNGKSDNDDGDSNDSGGNKDSKMPHNWDKHILSSEGDIRQDEVDAIRRKSKQNIAMAAQMAKARGTMHGAFQGMIDAFLKDIINWRTLLSNFITNMLPVDYTFRRPHRNSLSTGSYMPSIVRESIDVVIAIDTSGSIGDNELSEFLGQAIRISRSYANVIMTLLFADMDIHDIIELTSSDSPEEILSHVRINGGRGGTSHLCIAEWVAEHKSNATAVVCLTDAFTEFPEPSSVVGSWMWVLPIGSGNVNIPFGIVIKMEE